MRNNTNCLVCGFDWRVPLVECRYEICDCCGVELNNEYEPDGSTSPQQIMAIRNEWLESGATWFIKGNKPEVWTKEKALEQIKANVPKEFQ